MTNNEISQLKMHRLASVAMPLNYYLISMNTEEMFFSKTKNEKIRRR